MRSKIDDDEFIKISANSRSMREAALKMQYSFSAFKKRAIKLGCYKTNQGWSKGKTTFDDYRIRSKYKIYDFNSIFCENSNVHRGSLKKIIIINKLIEYKCIKCENSGIWEGKKLFLQLDHINGIRNDNRIENLRILCPNCNASLETHCRGYKGLLKNRKKKGDINTEKEKEQNFGFSISEINSQKRQRKSNRPPYNQLLEEIKNYGFVGTGKIYNVSDNAIRKWIKMYEKYGENF